MRNGGKGQEEKEVGRRCIISYTSQMEQVKYRTGLANYVPSSFGALVEVKMLEHWSEDWFAKKSVHSSSEDT